MRSDLISRHAAIDALLGITAIRNTIPLDSAIFNIKKLPSAEPRWIPCSERLPNLNKDGASAMLLLCWSDGQRTVGAYLGNCTFVGQAWPMARDCRVTVIAWMPLPEAYEGVGE